MDGMDDGFVITDVELRLASEDGVYPDVGWVSFEVNGILRICVRVSVARDGRLTLKFPRLPDEGGEDRTLVWPVDGAAYEVVLHDVVVALELRGMETEDKFRRRARGG